MVPRQRPRQRHDGSYGLATPLAKGGAREHANAVLLRSKQRGQTEGRVRVAGVCEVMVQALIRVGGIRMGCSKLAVQILPKIFSLLFLLPQNQSARGNTVELQQ
jgi:hypothetical protein